MEKFFFPVIVGIFTFDDIPLDSTFPYLYLDLACKQLCFRPGKSINMRNESSISELFRTLESFFRISVQLLIICSTDDI